MEGVGKAVSGRGVVKLVCNTAITDVHPISAPPLCFPRRLDENSTPVSPLLVEPGEPTSKNNLFKNCGSSDVKLADQGSQSSVSDEALSVNLEWGEKQDPTHNARLISSSRALGVLGGMKNLKVVENVHTLNRVILWY